MTVTRPLLATALVAPLLAASPASANDSEAEIGLGGLVLTRSADIRMDSEELSISAERIKVDYVFTNTAPTDVEILVAFPLPDIQHDFEVRTPDYVKDLEFRTLVDGRPAQLTLTQSASFKGTDITARLAGLGVPVMPVPDAFNPAINRLTPTVRGALVAEGLIAEEGTSGSETLWVAKWKTATSVTRRQVFPAGRPIAVSHSYKPFVGSSVAGRLEARSRNEPDFAVARAKYCIDGDFLKGLDRRVATAAKDGSSYYEQWISYVLTSGANWKGPIGRFHMVVDKGDPRALVSFCANGVKKIDKTRFEVTYQNFVPKKDADILILKFAK